MILADTTAAPAQPTVDMIWIVLVILSGIAANIATVFLAKAAFKRQVIDVGGGTLNIRELHDVIRRPEFDRHVSDTKHEVEMLKTLLDGKFNEMKDSAEIGREKIHKRVNRVALGVAKLCGKFGVSMPKEEDEL